ncbi:phage tail tape measure protein [Yoonia sp. 208BN28-4]|uniref:phage tail tape measure protein n=1 Tax=Yoonia sp. 208BN28-4 TaxID=3126505 RepID=UPI003098A282
MIGNIGKLWVSLGLKDRDLRNGLKSNERLLAGFGRRLAIVGAAAGAAAAGGLAVLGRQSLSQIDNLSKLARDLGTTTASMQIMERAGDLAGVGMSGIAQATKDLTRRLSQAADGTGPAVTALQRLNLTAEELMAMPLDQRIATINGRIDEFVPAAARAAVAGQLFGEEGSIAMARLDSTVLSQAVADVERFGVAVSDVDAAQIERTNDAMSRLSLIGTGLGNQIAVAVAPALERMAGWLGDIAQIGGPVNTAINLIAGNLDRLAVYAGVAATVIGVRYVAAVTVAAARTLTFATSLRVLRAALIRTGIGALIVLAGELVLALDRGIKKVGGFGASLALLKDVAIEVWDRIKTGFMIIPAAISVGSAKMQSFFVTAIGTMASKFVEFTWSVAEGLNGLFGTDLSGASAVFVQDLNRAAIAADGVVASRSAALSSLAAQASAPLTSLAALRAATAETASETDNLTASVDAVNDAFEDTGGAGGGAGSGGGGAAGDAAAGISAVGDAAVQTDSRLSDLKSSFSGVFDGLIAQGKGLRGVLSDLASDFARMASNAAFNTFWMGGSQTEGQAGLSGLLASALPALPGFANGTNYAPGGWARINERGGEIVNLPNGSQVIPHQMSKDMMAGGAVSETRHYHINAQHAQVGVADQIVGALKAYDQKMPERQQQITTDKRFR